ncbi:MAG TPA: tyrosine-type recombinase/integrase [Rhizomicrobium sp.]|jgi:integrase
MRATGHIRQRTRGSWEIRYSLGTNAATGKRRTATTTIKGDRRAAEKELRRLLRTLDTGEHVDPSRVTLRKWLVEWLVAVKQEVSPKSYERYAEIVYNYLAPELGALLINKLAPADIQKVYARWAIQGRHDGKTGGLSPRTRRQIHHILRSALARAVEQQIIARNPADMFKKRLPKIERQEMATLNPEQSARFLDTIRHTRVYWPSLVALATGMRRGEILALRWKNIDLERGIVRVVESLEQTKAGLRFKAPKTDKARAITLPRFATEELRRLKREQAESLLALGVRQTGETLALARADGKPLQPRSLTHEFSRLVGRMKDMPRVRFHDLRHSHATQLLSEGVHPKVAQERLGHSTISTTLDLYSHVTDTMQEDAATRLDAVFQAAINRTARAN